eukprot:c25364_g1_i1 orf=478-2589(+)
MTSTLAPGLARKLKKVLETRTDSPDLLKSLSTLSSFYTENPLQGRRTLPTTIEKRGLSINEEFLRASEEAQKALDAVETEVVGLAECCDRIARSLSTCSATTGEIMAVTERLKQELENTNQRQEIVTSFLHDYQLSQEEVLALREDELNENFFKALSRVQEIHASCKILLRTHHQRAGLELMDMMAVYQEGAYERLCRWVQAECRNLGDNDMPEVSDLLRAAARCLNERPVLFKYCAEEVANTRHNALFRRFISALTRGGPGGMPRPIEVHAHDPLRYVGDMLAWLHQALASERELAMALFSLDTNIGSASRRFSKDSDQDGKPETDVGFILDRIFEGVCRPFKVRVEQVLQSQPGLLLSYKLNNLLEFYCNTITELLGHGASLSVTMRDVTNAAQRTFFDILKVRGDKLLRYLSPVSSDLSPPPAVAEGVSVLLELIETYNGMMVPAGGKKPDFGPVISAMLDPIIQMCERSAEAYVSKAPMQSLRSSTSTETNRRFSSLPSRASSREVVTDNSRVNLSAQRVNSLCKIFLINCLSAIQGPLSSHEIAQNFVDSLGSKIKGLLAASVDEEVNTMLEKCKLQKKVTYIREHSQKYSQCEIVLKEEEADDGKSVADWEEMSPSAITESLQLFSALVVGNESIVPEFEQFQVPHLRNEASSQVSKALLEAYKLVYDAAPELINGYPEPNSMQWHTPDQIRTILGI